MIGANTKHRGGTEAGGQVLKRKEHVLDAKVPIEQTSVFVHV